LVINFSAAVLSTVVVGIFAIAKFTEGAWLVVVVFPVLVLALIRLNREYRAEAAILEAFRTDRPQLVKYARHRVFVMVNSLDLAVLHALRYGKGLRADELIAVHFMIDSERAAELRKRWDSFDLDTRLRVVDCPDRQIIRALQAEVVKVQSEHPDTNVTVLLPRRTYAPFLGRILHDRTADKISRAVSQIPDAAATIVPYDVQSRIREAFPDILEMRIARQVEKVENRIWQGENKTVEDYEHPERSGTAIPVDSLIPGRRASVEGRVSQVEDISKRGRTFRWIVVGDESGEIRVTFRPGQGDDIQPGQVLRLTGKANQSGTHEVSMLDPTYQIIETPEET
jgi:OB-fold nucleic acid binding domain